MIRINLLGVARPTKAAGPPPTVARHAVIFIVSAVVAFGIVGFFYRYWSSQIDTLNKQKAEQQRERDRLAQIRAENDRYRAQLQQLQQRQDTIQQLQDSKAGPVDFMDRLGDIVNRSNDLYLLAVTPDGPRVSIRGQSNSVESIANFIAHLKGSGSFDNVHLAQYYQDDQNNRLSFKFNLDCTYKLPSAAHPVAQAAGGSAAPGRPPAGL
ncbi:MAG: PilN domain-containing protein [Acidobacteriia bacterium]|nr:PilN domain-containing protein [Terriglobia bacterium]